MKMLTTTTFIFFIAFAAVEAQELNPIAQVAEPFLTFLRKSSDDVENGVIDVNRFSEDIITEFSKMMTGRSPMEAAVLEKLNEALAIRQLDKAIEVSCSCSCLSSKPG